MSVVLAAATLGLTRQNLLDQRESTAPGPHLPERGQRRPAAPAAERRRGRPPGRPHRAARVDPDADRLEPGARRRRPLVRPLPRVRRGGAAGVAAHHGAIRPAGADALRPRGRDPARRRRPAAVDRRRLLRDRVARRAGGDARVDQHLAARGGAAVHAGRRGGRVVGVAAGAAPPARHRRRGPRHRHRATSRPASRPAPTPTSPRSPTRSTRWPSRLEERIERDARFASNVSHELRSPLMTLAASIEVLENQRDDMPDPGPGRARPDGRRHRALPAARRGPARDLPLRRRRDVPRPGGGARRRAGPAGGPDVDRRRRAGRHRLRPGRRRGQGRQAAPVPGHRQPARQRGQVRRRRHPRRAAQARATPC